MALMNSACIGGENMVAQPDREGAQQALEGGRGGGRSADVAASMRRRRRHEERTFCKVAAVRAEEATTLVWTVRQGRATRSLQIPSYFSGEQAVDQGLGVNALFGDVR